MAKSLPDPVWIDSTPLTHVVVCDACGQHWIYLLLFQAEAFAGRHRRDEMTPCSVAGCEEPARKAGMCLADYQADYRRKRKRTA